MIKVNGVEMETTWFPNGEMKVSDFEVKPMNGVTMSWENSNDLIMLMFIKKHIDDFRGNAVLTLTHMPYSRMDRRIEGSVFTLKYICDFINYLQFTSIELYGAHSDVAPALLDRCNNVEIVERVLEDARILSGQFFFPDAGAQKRFSFLGNMNTDVVGFKKRNVLTGHIDKYDILGEVVPGGTVVIIDDLCSKGGTFELASKCLKEAGAGDIYLVVGHCEYSIFSGGILSQGSSIKKVFTSNSMLDVRYSGSKLEIFNYFN